MLNIRWRSKNNGGMKVRDPRTERTKIFDFCHSFFVLESLIKRSMWHQQQKQKGLVVDLQERPKEKDLTRMQLM